MTYSLIPGFTLILDSLTWNHERTVFTRIANGDIQMDTTTHMNKGGYRGMGVRTGSDVEHTSVIRRDQSKALLKFLYREIKTVEQLKELKLGSAIRSVERGIVSEVTKSSTCSRIWLSAGIEDQYEDAEMADMLPALVIFEAE